MHSLYLICFALDDSECQEKRALMLIVLMLLKGNVTENLKRFYIEHQVCNIYVCDTFHCQLFMFFMNVQMFYCFYCMHTDHYHFNVDIVCYVRLMKT